MSAISELNPITQEVDVLVEILSQDPARTRFPPNMKNPAKAG
jgi:hypothetical protein